MLTEEKCNAKRVVEFLIKVRKIYPNKRIIIILDNATYNHARYTTTFAEWYNIKLFFLPPYSPNLNIIERLWKFTKKKLVHNKYYEKFEQFIQEVEKYFQQINQHQEELNTLFNQKFQIIHNV